MAKIGLIDKLTDNLYLEKLRTDVEASSPLRQDTNKVRSVLLNIVKEAGKTTNIDLILQVEKAFTVNDLNLYGNSKEMRGSLSEAKAGLEQTEHMLTRVREPEKYEEVNQIYALKKSRRGGLPFDEARKFFPGQVTRLRNMDKSRLTAEEKKIITQRQANLRVAEKIYTILQREALNAPSPKQSSRDRGFSME